MASFNLKRFIKHPLKGLENAGRSAGKVAQTAAPFLPPGFREAASIGGSIAAGGNMKDHVMSGVGAYVGSRLGGRKLGQSMSGLLKGGVASSAGNVFNTLRGKGGVPELDPRRLQDMIGTTDQGMIAGARRDAGVSGGSGGWLDKATGIVKGVRQATGGKPITLKNTLGGAVRKIGSTIRDNPLEAIGAGAAGYSAASAFKRAGDFEGKAIKTKEQSYNERAPLRARGVSGMLKDTAAPKQDFVNTQNPFARKRKVGS